MSRTVSALIPLALLAGAAGCSRAPAPAPMPIAAAPVAPPPVITLPMPQPPTGSAPGLAVPARLADGGYATPNRGVSDAAAIWHLRAGLNVATLTCIAEDLAPAYNRFLSQQRATLAGAYKTLSREAGDAAQFDTAMTRLYNYFAQPAPQPGFCAAAARMLREAAALPPDTLAGFAPGALARLDRPFTDFYAAYDRYREQLALWRMSRTASAAPLIVADPAVLAEGSQPTGSAEPGALVARR
jgi:hypothetical protein